jgi:hypothetical protein
MCRANDSSIFGKLACGPPKNLSEFLIRISAEGRIFFYGRSTGTQTSPATEISSKAIKASHLPLNRFR